MWFKNLLKLVRDRLHRPDPPRRNPTCEWCARPSGCCDCQERIGCPRAGHILHMQCGWCITCDVPMFACTAQHWERRPR